MLTRLIILFSIIFTVSLQSESVPEHIVQLSSNTVGQIKETFYHNVGSFVLIQKHCQELLSPYRYRYMALTNHHVVFDSSGSLRDFQVYLPGDQGLTHTSGFLIQAFDVFEAPVIKTIFNQKIRTMNFKPLDLALIMFESNVDHPVVMIDESPKQLTSTVFHVGFPTGSEGQHIMKGKILFKMPQWFCYNHDHFSTAHAQPGMSGGAVFDETGSLIGLTYLGIQLVEHETFVSGFLPMNVILNALRH